MRTKMRAILVVVMLAVASGLLLAQATHISTSGTLPTNCRVGDIYNKTGTSAGLYRCSATNTWTAVGSGAGDVVGPSSATADRIAVFDGTTGKLIKDGGTTIAAITAGAGATISTSAFASPPSSPSSGDLWLPSDSFYANRYSGSAWIPWGPIWPLTAPASSSAPTTWVNQGSATLTTTSGAYVLTVPAGSDSDNMRYLVKTAPSTPYTITALFLTDHWPLNFFMSGLFFRQSSDGKLIICDYNVNSASRTYEVIKFTNPTTFSASVSVTSGSRTLGDAALVWMQISDDGSNRKMRVSTNGYNWTELYSEGRTTFLTADQVGWGVNAYNATRGYTMTLLSWKET